MSAYAVWVLLRIGFWLGVVSDCGWCGFYDYLCLYGGVLVMWKCFIDCIGCVLVRVLCCVGVFVYVCCRFQVLMLLLMRFCEVALGL